MADYLAASPADRERMLAKIGAKDITDLYESVPEKLRVKGNLHLPAGLDEMSVRREMEALARKNTVFPTVLRGAGAYRHYIPAVVPEIVSKETFVTAYTPYQAEISQGVLQSIFEYQTVICELTGMDVSNASVYDGATAAAEAAASCRDRRRKTVLVSACAHPDVLRVMKTYAWAADTPLTVVPEKNGRTDMEALAGLLDSSVAAVYVPQVNYYGCIEEAEEAARLAHEAGAKLILGVDPLAAVLLKSAADCGADIAVGEGQQLGMPLSWGGPFLGFMAAKHDMMRKLPGRIVGETKDDAGNRAFVLTLQAREQHIKREKASSNICSNEALCAMTASVYAAAMGPEGLRQAALQSMSKAHYLAQELEKIGWRRAFEADFFQEFVTEAPEGTDIAAALAALEKAGILGGLPLGGGRVLWCATEVVSRQEMDRTAQILKEVRA
ncbi:MAG: aminomethyl-transferring glycine dehydrogenase subunit GcvPA [Lachnospiraceae bacterium]|nr:aminomethyl-transferring glycine dehydrogenase subunit GcvPA [Lachnospiraceae bacterium]